MSVEEAETKPVRKIRPSKEWGVDPLSYYRTHYADLTRGKLLVSNLKLYRALNQLGLLDQVPTKDDLPSPWKGKDLLEFYKDNYPTVSRTKLLSVDKDFSNALKRAGLFKQIPLEEELHPWGNDPLAYYKQEHAGKTQRDLVVLNWSLYLALKKKKLLGEIPQ